MKYPRYTNTSEFSYVFGIYPIITLLNKIPSQVEEIILSSKADEGEGIVKLKDLANKNNIPITFNNAQINRLTTNDSVIAIAVFKKYLSKLDTGENHLVLVNPSDMGNVGTIIRTAVGFNIINVAIIRPAVDIFDPKVIRASMGSVFSSNIEYFDTFEDYIFSNEKRRTYYIFMTDGESSIKKVQKNTPFSLVYGNEGAGLDESYKNFGKTVYIPQSEDIDSLNLAMSVGIGLYEFSV